MKKRFLIVFALCALLLSLPASAESTGTCGANLTWRLDDSGVLTISGTGDMTEYDTWSNATVPWGRSVTKVSILEGVTSIGREAFNYCGSLTEITIPATVSRIGACAFYYCDSLPEVTIPNSVKTICEYAFYACGSLETIVLPDSVTVVEYGAFLDCGSLTSAVMGNSVISIGGNAFYHCAKLTSVTIPNPDTVIGQDAFLGCGSDLIIRCKAGSKAQEYAEANGIRVELIVTRPVITRQPISVSVMEGNTAVFQATATDAETYR